MLLSILAVVKAESCLCIMNSTNSGSVSRSSCKIAGFEGLSVELWNAHYKKEIQETSLSGVGNIVNHIFCVRTQHEG